jgi:AraC-like DNA-binding protein
MSVTVNKQTITVESFNWAAGVNASREEANKFLNELTFALGKSSASKIELPVADLKASVEVVDLVIQPDGKKSYPMSEPNSNDIRLAKQAMVELYVGMRYRPIEEELAGRIAAAGYSDLYTVKNIVSMLSNYVNLKQDKMQLDLGLRPSQFERVFSVFFEGTFTSVQREITLMRAAKMLEDNVIGKIFDIGKALGYSKAGFRSAFTAFFGISPQDYRIQYRKSRAKEALAELVHA